MTANTIKSYSFDRNSVKAGILHFGVGNFHRAHLEYMTSHLLEDPTQHGWGICGAMILERDEPLYKALKAQDGEYTLTVCGRDGNNEVYRLGALVELYWGIEEKNSILNKIADPDIRIITLTITEGAITSHARLASLCSTIRRWSTIWSIQTTRRLHSVMWPRDFVAAWPQAQALSPSSLVTIFSTMAIRPAALSCRL